jgi:hypothetical protein
MEKYFYDASQRHYSEVYDYVLVVVLLKVVKSEESSWLVPYDAARCCLLWWSAGKSS